MRFVTVRLPGAVPGRVGVLSGEMVHLLRGSHRLIDLLGDDGATLRAAGAAALADPDGVVALAGAVLGAPIPEPPSIRDFMTFESHAAGTGRLFRPDRPIVEQWYAAPAFYFTNPAAVGGPYDDVPVPPGCQQLDFECEVAAVVGREGHDLDPDEATAHIAGYLLCNDWSARDLQFAESRVGLGPVKGKDSTTTLGPWLVTPDELEPHRQGTSFAVTLTAVVNGREIGRDRMDSMYWSFGEMLAYASRGTRLRPGDVLASGTCGGGCLAETWGRLGWEAGLAAAPPLQPGDVVEISATGLGSLRNRVVAGVTPRPLRR